MKHRLIIAMIATAMLAFGLTGCVIEHQVDKPEDSGKQIVFTPSVEKGAASRAATGHPVGETAVVIPDGSSFGMYALESAQGDGTDIALYSSLSNQKVTRDGTGMTYAPVVNWPGSSTAKLAFFGYYPWIAQTGTPNPAVTMNATTRKMTINYTVPASPAQHIDLMYTRKGLTAGYEAVPLVFGHALTWLRFSASAVDYSEDVKITKITVKGAKTIGTLTVSETGTPVWALASDKADYAITSAGGGLNTTALTSTMAAVNTAAGHMLVLPQSVTGLTLEVEATLGGVALPAPFVYELDNSTDWLMNRIVTYQIALANDEMTVTTKVNDWSQNNVNVIYDGQWFLSVTKDEIELDGTASSDQIVAETNYNTTQFGYPVGLQYSAAEIVYGGSTSDWLTVSGGNNGDLSRTLTFAAQANTLYEERTAEVKIKAGNLTKVIYVTQAQKLPELPVDPGEGNVPMDNAYVGAFWKSGQRGERLISMPISSEQTGKWAVQVLDYGGFAEGDILFEAWNGTLPGNDFPNGDTPELSANKATYVTGNMTVSGNLHFKIGLKQTIATGAHRYARIVVSFGKNGSDEYAYNRVLWLRQGEAEDYLMAQGDAGINAPNAARPAAARFLPYNLTTDGNIATTPFAFQETQNGGVPTAYPTQAGALWQFASDDNPRYAYSPVTKSGIWIDKNTVDWDDDQETCPVGYRRPNGAYQSTVGNEFYQSLIATEGSTTANSVWGYYADGYFDRYTKEDAPNYGPEKSIVNPTSINAGYIGRLFYNPVKLSSHYGASIFFPASGNRGSTNLAQMGNRGYYWSSTPEADLSSGCFLQVYSTSVTATDRNSRGLGYSIRCVKFETP